MIYLLLLLTFFFSAFGFGGSRMVEKTLNNGVRIILKETKGEGILGGYIFIKSGTHEEWKRGLTNLTSIMLLRGTKKFDSFQIASAFEDYGGSISADTTDDYVQIGFATKTEGLDKALEVLESMLLEPTFPEEQLEREKKNVISAIRSKREKGFELAMENLRRLTFKGTPYEVSPLGTEEDVSKIEKDDLVKRWNQILKGKNVVFVLVGDFNAEEVLPKVEKVLSKIPPGEFTFKEENTSVEESKVVYVSRQGAQATILCAWNGPKLDDGNWFSFKVLDAVLGTGMTSKLFQFLREQKGYAYATYSMFPTRLFSPRLFTYVGTSPDKAEDALKDMLEVVRNSTIKEEDVELAKSKIIGGFLLSHQTRLSQAWYLGFYEVMGLGWKMDEEYPKLIQKVSLKDVLSARDRFIKEHHCVVVKP